MNPTYTYLSIHLFPLIKQLVTVVLIAILYMWWGRAWSVWLPLAIFGGFGLIILSRLGQITIHNKGGRELIKIKRFFQITELSTPLQYESAWTYSFNEGEDAHDTDASGKGQSSANNLHVYLILTEPSGNSITFQEVIDAGTRFPNETTYSRSPKPIGSIILVQRTDRLRAFLIKYLKDESLIPKR